RDGEGRARTGAVLQSEGPAAVGGMRLDLVRQPPPPALGGGPVVRHPLEGVLVVPALSWPFFFQAEDGIRARNVTGVQTCALPICPHMRSRTVAPPLVDQLTDRFALESTGPVRSQPGQEVRPRDPPRFAPLGDEGGDYPADRKSVV